MKDIVDVLNKNKIICKKLNKIELKTKKKIKAYLGVNLKNEYCFIAIFYKKSPFLPKDIKILEEILPKINFRYKKKILILNSTITPKAKEKLSEWRILWF